MPATFEIVIVDTSCFILLDNIGELELLKSLFERVVTTNIIAQEFGAILPEWIDIRTVKDVNFQSTLDIDAGEASAIALAMESEASLLVLDDNKVRKAARRLNLNFTGSLGLFLKAKQVGLIPAVKPMIDKIPQVSEQFFISGIYFYNHLILKIIYL